MRLRLFLGMTAVLVVVAGLTALVAQRLDDGGGASDQVVGGADGTVAPGTGDSTTTTGDDPTVVPSEGQVLVRGTVTAVHLEGALLDPGSVPTPLTVTAQAGFGNGGEILGATVDGRDASIVWDGGRAFVLSSGGALVLEPVNVDLSPEGLRLALATGIHGFTPGTYQLDTPVAVGTTGIATPRESATFTADAETRFQPAGDAALFLGPEAARTFTGPGVVHLEGTLEVTEPAGARSATVVDLADGAYEITFTPAAGGGWTVEATLQGGATAT